MTDKFNNLINSTYAGLMEAAASATPSAEEIVQNPELQLTQQAATIKAAGGGKTPQEKALLKKAEEIEAAKGKTASETVKKVNDLQQAQKEVST